MTLDMNEKGALFPFGCPNHESTLKRLQMLSALATDPYAKRFFHTLTEKLADEKHCIAVTTTICAWRWSSIILTSTRKTGLGVEHWEVEAMKLTKYEKETIILMNEGDSRMKVYTFNADLKRRLAKFAQRYPELCKLTSSTEEGLETYEMDKSRLSFRLVPPYSEERRRAASEKAKKNGFTGK